MQSKYLLPSKDEKRTAVVSNLLRNRLVNFNIQCFFVIQVDFLYLTINGTNPTLTQSKFRQIFENGSPKKSIDLPISQSLTEQEYKDVETELAKVLNPNQTREMMQKFHGIRSDPETTTVCFLLIFIVKICFF